MRARQSAFKNSPFKSKHYLRRCVPEIKYQFATPETTKKRNNTPRNENICGVHFFCFVGARNFISCQHMYDTQQQQHQQQKKESVRFPWSHQFEIVKV